MVPPGTNPHDYNAQDGTTRVPVAPMRLLRSISMTSPRLLLSTLIFAVLLGAGLAQDGKDDWIVLFNGKDTTGWKLRGEKITVTKFVDADGNAIAGAKAGKVGGKD